MKRMGARGAVVVGLCAFAVVACSSGTRGESSKSAAEIFTDARAATLSLTSLHVAGAFTNAGFNSIDLYVDQRHGGGSVTVNHRPVSVYADQNDVYLMAAPDTWVALSKNPLSQRLGNRWVQFPSGSAMFLQFGVNSVQRLITGTLNQDPNSLTKGRLVSYRGHEAIPLRVAGQTIYVADQGPPYVLGIESIGAVTFDQFNTAAVPSAPATSTPADSLLR